MLVKYENFLDASIESLLCVYSGSIGDLSWRAEQAFLEDLQLFYSCKNVFIACWFDCGTAVCAMRVEPYQDGYLISCLETAPDKRRMGYAGALLASVMDRQPAVYYSHVDKNNDASLRLHHKLCFKKMLDYAVHVDGSVYANSYTMKCEKNRC